MTPDEIEAYLKPKETDGGVILNPHPHFYDAMRTQFAEQANDVRGLIDLIDGPDEAVEDTQIRIVHAV